MAVNQHTTTPAVDGREWLSLPEVPASQELTSWAKCVQGHGPPENRLRGPWPSTESYLRSQYAFCREESIFALRKALYELKAAPGMGESKLREVAPGAGIYDKVRVKGLTFATKGVALRLAFCTRRCAVKISWDTSKRLVSGSLVALTSSSLLAKDVVYPAIVAARPIDNLNKPRPEIDVFVAPDCVIEELDEEYILVESTASYFEAQRHTMLALQEMVKEASATASFPMSRYVVDVQANVPPAGYVQRDPVMDMTPALGDDPQYESIDVCAHDWSQLSHQTMDDSQKYALQHMLTKELAIVQGPPGTGKTHVSVLAIKTMLGQMKPQDPPLIIACQTNHALDALLEHLDPRYHENYVRLGGRSTSDHVKDRTLYNVREKHREQGCGDNGSQRRIERQIRLHLGELYPEEKLLVDDECFLRHDLLTEAQYRSLDGNEDKWASEDAEEEDDGAGGKSLLEKWLVDPLQPPQETSTTPENYGFDVAETDPDEELLDEATAEQIAQQQDIYALKGPYLELSEGAYFPRPSISMTSMLGTLLKRVSDLYKIPPDMRGAVYTMLLGTLNARVMAKCQTLFGKYQKEGDARLKNRQKENAVICGEHKLIAATITGFAKNRGLISALRPRAVLVEEAGEALEAHQIILCVPSVEQLILVGDHQQLRPRCQKLEHERSGYGVSLMERLVLNDIDFKRLDVQRRMVPEISRLIQPIYGDTLKDHPSLLGENRHESRPDIPGMSSYSSGFINHSFPEGRDRELSTFNEKEAQMIAGFAQYLVQNGTLPEQIVILTFYNGQRKVLSRRLSEQPYLFNRPGIQVKTVDSFQGEEADVVLLSLVRNNSEGKVGFAGMSNRICVAMSRARRGFYLFGNQDLLWQFGGQTWRDILVILHNEGPDSTRLRGVESSHNHVLNSRVHDSLMLWCKNHETKSHVSDPEYWRAHPHGGCTRMCLSRLGCGHVCPLRCHPFGHEEVSCSEMCDKILPCGHLCNARCGEVCYCKRCVKSQPGRIEIDAGFSRPSSGGQKVLRSTMAEGDRGTSIQAARRDVKRVIDVFPASRPAQLIDFSDDETPGLKPLPGARPFPQLTDLREGLAAGANNVRPASASFEQQGDSHSSQSRPVGAKVLKPTFASVAQQGGSHSSHSRPSLQGPLPSSSSTAQQGRGQFKAANAHLSTEKENMNQSAQKQRGSKKNVSLLD